MSIELLKCDICGGNIIIKPGGTSGVCNNCGANYSVERMREIYTGMKVSMTGTDEDIAQWRELTSTYLDHKDFYSAEETIKKILEADPSDPYAIDVYEKLQIWKCINISDDILQLYTGDLVSLELPSGIATVGRESIKAKNVYTRLEEVILPIGVKRIEDRAFYGQCALKSILLPETIEYIGNGAFAGCCKLEKLIIPESVKTIGANAFENVGTGIPINGLISGKKEPTLQVLKLPEGLQEIGLNALLRVPRDKVQYSGKLSLEEAFDSSYRLRMEEKREQEIIVLNRKANWKNRNLCQYCGGTFKGVFSKSCSNCGKKKDY